MKAIIFTHHSVNEKIKERFENIKKLNPNWELIPVGFKGYNLLSNSHHVDKTNYPSNKNLSRFTSNSEDWCDPDLLIYDAYKNFPQYDGYFVYEYDTICNVPINEFFDTDCELLGNDIKDPAPENWYWAKMYRELNPLNSLIPELKSYGVSTCVYFSERVLKLTLEEIQNKPRLYDNMLSEARAGTITSKFAKLKKARTRIAEYIGWRTEDITVDLSRPYFYHPVK